MKRFLLIILSLFVLFGCANKNTTETSSFSIWYYSVGNADAALVECDGHYMMIDCGSNDVDISDNSNIYKIDRYLQQENVTHFDYIVCTHPDEDHYEGFVDILEGDGQSRTVDKIYCSIKGSELDTPKFNEFKSSVQTFIKKITVPKEGHKFMLGLAVNVDGKGTENDSSIVLMITYGNTKFLFTGDAEYRTEAYLVENKDIKCDVLKVAHHGSSTSTSDDFILKADPKYAVISVGNQNRYGHPSGVVLDRFERKNISIFRTDNGTVHCTSDGENITIENMK